MIKVGIIEELLGRYKTGKLHQKAKEEKQRRWERAEAQNTKGLFRNWGLKKLNNLPKFTEPIIGKAIIQIQKFYQILSGVF